jgi:hypothetical protein
MMFYLGQLDYIGKLNGLVAGTVAYTAIAIGAAIPAQVGQLYIKGGAGTQNTYLTGTHNAIIEGPDFPLYPSGNNAANLSVYSNDAIGIDRGGSISFGAKYDGNSAAEFAKIKAGKDTGVAGAYTGYLAIGTQQGGGILEVMRFASSGNVGIGAINPVVQNGGDRLLHIHGGAFGCEIRMTNTASGSAASNGVLLELLGSDCFLWNFEAGKVSIGTNGVERVVIETTGYLTLNNATVINFKNSLGTARPVLQMFSDNNVYLEAIDGAIKFRSSGSQLERARISNSEYGIYVFNSGAGSALADAVQVYSVDHSAGNTVPAFRTEGTAVTTAGITNTTVTHKVAVYVNGNFYYLLATTNGT